MVVDCRRSNEWFAARQGQLGDGRGAQPHRSRGRRRRALHRHGRLERWEVVCLMAMDALTRSSIEVALYIAFVTYLRPGEVMKLHVRDLVPPVGSTNVWSLILHPLERETPLKTGEFDETALFDLLDIQWIAEHCFRLLEVGSPVEIETVRSFMRSVTARFGMDTAMGDPRPYRLRHGGPSRDALHGRRTLQEIQKRGRWRSFNSVCRYESRVTQQLQALPKASLKRALAASQQIQAVVCGPP